MCSLSVPWNNKQHINRYCFLNHYQPTMTRAIILEWLVCCRYNLWPGISFRLINAMLCAFSDTLPTEAPLTELRCITRSTCKLTLIVIADN